MLGPHLRRESLMSTRKSATLLVTAAVIALAIAGGITASGADAAPIWQPSKAQLENALAVMQAEAWLSSPQAAASGDTAPAVVQDVQAGRLTTPNSDTSLPAAWPPDTTDVSYVVVSRSASEQWIDGTAAPDNRNVIVARLLGEFTFMTSAPQGAQAQVSGTVLTITIDPDSGQVMDVALNQDQATSMKMHAGTPVFKR